MVAFEHLGHVSITGNRPSGVDAAFMQLGRHGWDIHAVSSGVGAARLVSPVTEANPERNGNGIGSRVQVACR